jgi:hypothetical protein
MAYLHPALEQFHGRLQGLYHRHESVTVEDEHQIVAYLTFLATFQPPQPFQFPSGIVGFHPKLSDMSGACVQLIHQISVVWNCIQYKIYS